MTTKAQWLALAEQFETAEGPSDNERDLGIALLTALGWQFENVADCSWAWLDRDGRIVACFFTPASSLDHITAVIERGWPEANCHGYEKSPAGTSAFIARNNVSSGHWMVESEPCATPALALCAAFARAMSERASENE